VDDRKLVFKHYCLTWGPIDVLSTVPFDLIGEAFLDDNALFLRTFRLFRVLRMVRLLKLARLLKMRKTLAALEGIWTVHTGVFRLFRLIAEVMFIAHLLACMWHFIPLLEAPPTSGRSSWFNVAGIDDSTALSTRYTIALYVVSAVMACSTWCHAFGTSLYRYWSTKTMMSVGYGDVHAVSTAERIYSIFTQVNPRLAFALHRCSNSPCAAYPCRAPSVSVYPPSVSSLPTYHRSLARSMCGGPPSQSDCRKCASTFMTARCRSICSAAS